MSMNTRPSSENPPAPLGDLGDLGARVPLRDLVLPTQRQEVAAAPALFLGLTVIEAGIVFTAVAAFFSAMYLHKNRKTAAQALDIASDTFNTGQSELRARFKKEFGPFLKDLALASQQTGADIRPLLSERLLPMLPASMRWLGEKMIQSLPTLVPADTRQSQRGKPPLKTIKNPASSTQVTATPPLQIRPQAIQRTLPPSPTSRRPNTPTVNTPPVTMQRSPAPVKPQQVKPTPYTPPKPSAIQKHVPTTTVKPMSLEAVLGPIGPIAGRLSDLKTAALMLKSATLQAGAPGLAQAQENLRTAYRQWAQEILKHPELKALATQIVGAAAGGSPLKPEDDKLAKLLIAAIANGLGSVVGMGLEAWLSGSTDPMKNTQRFVIALLVGAAVPQGAGFVEGALSNALGNVLDEFLGQQIGAYKQDPTAYGTAVAGGIVTAGIGHAFKPIFAKGMKLWKHEVAGISPFKPSEMAGMAEKDSPMRMSQEAGGVQSGKSSHGLTTGVSQTSPRLEDQYADVLDELVEKGDMNPEIFQYYNSLRSTVLGKAGDRLEGPFHLDTPINAAFKSFAEAQESIAKLVQEGLPSALAVDTFAVLDKNGKVESYVVSAWPGQLHSVSKDIQSAQKKMVKDWAQFHGKTVQLQSSEVKSPVVQGITAKNFSRLQNLTPAQQKLQTKLDRDFLDWQDLTQQEGETNFATSAFLTRNPIKGRIPMPGDVNLPTLANGFFDSIENAQKEIARLMSKEGLPGELVIHTHQVIDPRNKKVKGYLCSIWPGTLVAAGGAPENLAIVYRWAKANGFEVNLLKDSHNHPNGIPLPSGMGSGTKVFGNDFSGDLSIFAKDTVENFFHHQTLPDYSIWVKDLYGAAELNIIYKPMKSSDRDKLALSIVEAYEKQDAEKIENLMNKLFGFSIQRYEASGALRGASQEVDIYQSLREAIMNNKPFQEVFRQSQLATGTEGSTTVSALAVLTLLSTLASKVLIEQYKKQTEQTKPVQRP